MVMTVLVTASVSLIASTAHAELTGRGDLFVRFRGGIDPTALPRTHLAPIAVRVAGTVKRCRGTAAGPAQDQDRTEQRGELDSRGLPRCHYGQLVAVVAARALEACGDALVGDGAYIGKTAFPEQATFPLAGPDPCLQRPLPRA
jgi:hypothetical protein